MELVIEDGELVECIVEENEKSVVIPEGVTSIGLGLFADCSRISSIELPESLTKIYSGAFYDCSSLSDIELPEGIAWIECEVFSGCSSLKSIKLPRCLTEIPEETFRGCSSLTSVELPEKLKRIGKAAFSGCSSLASIKLPECVTCIDAGAFEGCSKLVNINIDHVKTIKDKYLLELKEYYKLNGKEITIDEVLKSKKASMWFHAIDVLDTEEIIKNISKAPKYYQEHILYRLMLKDNYAAAKYFEKIERLDEYAEANGKDVDEVRLSLFADLQLNVDGTRTWELAGAKYIATLQNDFTFVLTNEEGKVIKTIPKKNVDADEYVQVKDEISELKKNVKSICQLHKKRLLSDCISVKRYDVETWKEFYLENAILRKLAQLVLWQQDELLFTLSADGDMIDCNGQVLTLGDSEIVLAHPMEMSQSDIKAWQDYFTNNKIAQPFAQVWEPVYDKNSITKDRYKDTTIPLNMLMNRSFDGIVMKGQSVLELQDCSAKITLVESHSDWVNNEFEITEFEFDKYTRAVNHIVAHFDRGTVRGRLVKDDISVVQWFDMFTLAQIKEFIDIVTEAGNCPNVTAELLRYKEEKYPEADAFSDLILE